MNLWESLPGDNLQDTAGTKMTKAMFNKAYYQRRVDKSYAFGESFVDALGINWELSSQNDLCVPYFRKIGRKTEYTLSSGEYEAHKLGVLKAIREGIAVPERVLSYFSLQEAS